MKTYKLGIYTWPIMRGVSTGVRTSTHDTHQAALAALEAETLPYAYAAMQIWKEKAGYIPCDWEGREVGPTEHLAVRYGTNREHPDYLAMRSDWDVMIRMIQARGQTDRRGYIHIAGDVLRERHPREWGFVEWLARDAAGL